MGNADGIISEEDIDKTQEICYTYDKGIAGIGKRQGANGRERRGMLKKAMIVCCAAAICLIPFFFWDRAVGKLLGGVGFTFLILAQIFNSERLSADMKKAEKEKSEPNHPASDNSAADTLPPSQPEPPRTPYTLEDFKEDVAQTKAKMEELAAYLKTIDAAVKKQLESWDLDGCVEQLQKYMIPEMEKLLQQAETGTLPLKYRRNQLGSYYYIIDSWPCTSKPDRNKNPEIWDRLQEVGVMLSYLDRHYREDLP